MKASQLTASPPADITAHGGLQHLLQFSVSWKDIKLNEFD